MLQHLSTAGTSTSRTKLAIKFAIRLSLVWLYCSGWNILFLNYSILESFIITKTRNQNYFTRADSLRVSGIIFVSSILQDSLPKRISTHHFTISTFSFDRNRQQNQLVAKMGRRLLLYRIDNICDQNCVHQSVSTRALPSIPSLLWPRVYRRQISIKNSGNSHRTTHRIFRKRTFFMVSSTYMSSTSLLAATKLSTFYNDSFNRTLATTIANANPTRFVVGQRWIVGDNVLIPTSLLPASVLLAISEMKQPSSISSHDNNMVDKEYQINTIGTRQYYPGVIREIRGAGWYTATIAASQVGSEATTTSIKCRGTQIRQSTTQLKAAEFNDISMAIPNTKKRINDEVDNEELADSNDVKGRIRIDETHRMNSLEEQVRKTVQYKPKKSLTASTSHNHTVMSKSIDGKIEKIGIGVNALDVDTNMVQEFVSNQHQQQLHQVQLVSTRRLSEHKLDNPIPPSTTMYDLDSFRKKYQQEMLTSTSKIESSTTATFQSTLSQKNNMNEYYEQIEYFATNVKEWVVFTDLHCSPQTLTTCLDVLDTVHSIAVKRTQQLRSSLSSSDYTNNVYCGILFLGDFWHHRQTMRIDCLNTILAKFKSTFTVPMIMIPGNHDQITLGGSNHALTPLENAYRIPLPPSYFGNGNQFSMTNASSSSTALSSLPGILLFSHPTKFQNAFFIPHIRDCAIMESIVQSKLCYDDSDAIFVHADVTGACMNDLIVSTGGIPPTMFPPNKPIFSGHFHKPHIVTISSSIPGDDSSLLDDHSVNTIKIEYVGSPYEVSLAEAEQAKGLLILDPINQWKCIQRIPLDVGRKHFKVQSMNQLENLIERTKNGDRIVFNANRDVHAYSEINKEMKETLAIFRDKGVIVEVRETNIGHHSLSETPFDDSTAVVDFEDCCPTALWKSYLDHEEQSGKLKVSRDMLEKVGLDILDQLDNDDAESKHENSISGTSRLELSSVSVMGFGPFRDQVTYPLSERGLVLLRGCNNDGGSDSNGSGKTALAMSILWALTGSLDPRPLQDSKVTDVINDASKVARVTLQGTINGEHFSISRSKTATKSGLVFVLNGVDESTQSAKETQDVINEKLGVSSQIVARTMFQSQHSFNDLLEASDIKFKEELAMIVPTEVWLNALSLSRKKAKDASNRAARYDGMISLRSDDFKELQARLTDAQSSYEEIKVRYRHVLNENYMPQVSDEIVASNNMDNIDNEGMENEIHSLQSNIKALEIKRQKLVNEQSTKLETQKNYITKLSSSRDTTTLGTLQRQRYELRTQLAIKEEQIEALQNKWQVNLLDGFDSSSFAIPLNCPTCGQTITGVKNSYVDGHSHDELKEKAKIECENVVESLSNLLEMLKKIEDNVLNAEKTESEVISNLEEAKDRLDTISKEWNEKVSAVDAELANARSTYSVLSDKLTLRMKHMQAQSMHMQRNALYKTQFDAINAAHESVERIATEIDTCQTRISEIQSKHNESTLEAKLMSELTEAFGSKGVQSFVLRNAVKVLERVTDNYLYQLSDGKQRLQLSLDSGDKIVRRAFVYSGSVDQQMKERALASLSGGQWKRCSLALSLGFADVLAKRGQFCSSLLVLDEPLTHLDQSGRSHVGSVLRTLLQQSTVQNRANDNTQHDTSKDNPTQRKNTVIDDCFGLQVSTILVILQDLAAEEMEESFDCIDEVIKTNSQSTVRIDELSI